MGKKLQEQITRINEIMGTKQVLVESGGAVAKLAKPLVRYIADLTDDMVREVFPKLDTWGEDVVRKIRNGELNKISTQTVGGLMARMKRFDGLAKKVLHNNVEIGGTIKKVVDEKIPVVSEIPERRTDVIKNFNDAIDGLFDSLPDPEQYVGFKTALKRQTERYFDDALAQKRWAPNVGKAATSVDDMADNITKTVKEVIDESPEDDLTTLMNKILDNKSRASQSLL